MPQQNYRGYPGPQGGMPMNNNDPYYQSMGMGPFGQRGPDNYSHSGSYGNNSSGGGPQGYSFDSHNSSQMNRSGGSHSSGNNSFEGGFPHFLPQYDIRANQKSKVNKGIRQFSSQGQQPKTILG